MKSLKIKKWVDLLFVIAGIGFFTFMFVVKGLQSAIDWPAFKPFPAREQRMQERLPDYSKIEFKRWGEATEVWYNDNFAYRTEYIDLYRDLTIRRLKTPVDREVPGLNGWVYRKGTSWYELDDYVGAYELNNDELEILRRLFEGRTVWAKAMGAELLTIPVAPKAQGRPQFIPYAIRSHRGVSIAAQMRNYLSDTDADCNLLFIHDKLDEAVAAGHETFFEVDHHMNDYATFLMYDEINKFILKVWPDVAGEAPKYYGDSPPKEVLEGRAMGTWKKNERLAVSRPGDSQDQENLLALGQRYPYGNVRTIKKGDGSKLTVVMVHDSFMRFTLSGWRGKPGDMRFPFCDGVKVVYSYMFGKLTDGFFDSVTADSVPDLIIEQFPDFRLNEQKKMLTAFVENAALYGRGDSFYNGNSSSFKLGSGENIKEEFVRMKFVFSDLKANNNLPNNPFPKVNFKLLKNGNEIERFSIIRGVCRPYFTKAFKSDGIAEADEFSVVSDDGTWSSIDVEAVTASE